MTDQHGTAIRGRPSRVAKPADFDQFWEGVLDDVSRIPLAPETTPEPIRTSAEVEVFRVYYDSLDGVRISARFCLPVDRSGTLPGMMVLPGYNDGTHGFKEWARKGYAVLTVAPRGKLRSNRQFNLGYPGLLTYGIVDRNVYSYRGFYVDAWRRIDYLLSRPEVDPSRIGVTGGSQGGGLTITTVAMRHEVRAAAARAPYLCGFLDAIQLTHTYPYQEVNDYLRLHPESRRHVEETLPYFDGISFADRIRCPIVVNIGLQDNVCPPETGLGLFDAIGSEDKRLYRYDGHGHDAGGYRHNTIVEEFFQKHLAPPE